VARVTFEQDYLSAMVKMIKIVGEYEADAVAMSLQHFRRRPVTLGELMKVQVLEAELRNRGEFWNYAELN